MVQHADSVKPRQDFCNKADKPCIKAYSYI